MIKYITLIACLIVFTENIQAVELSCKEITSGRTVVVETDINKRINKEIEFAHVTDDIEKEQISHYESWLNSTSDAEKRKYYLKRIESLKNSYNTKNEYAKQKAINSYKIDMELINSGKLKCTQK